MLSPLASPNPTVETELRGWLPGALAPQGHVRVRADGRSLIIPVLVARRARPRVLGLPPDLSRRGPPRERGEVRRGRGKARRVRARGLTHRSA